MRFSSRSAVPLAARCQFAATLSVFVLSFGCGTFHTQTGGAAAIDTKTLRVAITADIASFDPDLANSSVDSELQFHVFEGLVRYDDKNAIEPALAESWELSPDRKTYIFHIRHGVKFHNGRDLSAADFKYSWERALSPRLKSPVAANYLDGIVGVKEVVSGKSPNLAGVVVADPYTLKVTLDRPRAYFLGMLTYGSGAAICKEAVEQNGNAINPKSMIGTGPFIFKSYAPGQRVELTANPAYWDGKPAVDRLDVEILVNPDTAYNNFVTKQLDITPVTITHYVQDRDAGKLKDSYHLVPNASIAYLCMYPGKQPVFANAKVRQAFMLAIDRKAINQIAYKNTAQVADGVVPPGMLGSTPSPAPISPDPAKAKRLLAEAGYPDGKGFPTLTLTYAQNSPLAADTCQLVRNNLQSTLGITVNLAEREFGQLIHEYYAEKLEFYLAGWIADYPDPQDFLSTLFASNASLNHYGYKDPKFDALCNEADQEPDTAKRGALYARANAILMQDAGIIPIAFPPRLLLVQPYVHGWRSNVCLLLPHSKTTKSTSLTVK